MSKLVPKLRFKEFSGEWEEKKLGEYVDILSGESPSKFKFVDNGIPYYKVEQLNDSNKYLKDSFYHIKETKKIAKKGSLIFPKRGASILLNKIRILRNDSFIDTNLMSLYTKNNLSNEFLYYYILKVDLSKIADTTSIPQINNKHIDPYIIYLPTPKEQQKIANTLSSLDNLIEAYQRKVEALQKHKKGLMQQLFPAEGANVPKLRFKEFSGEWEEKKLSKISNITTGSSNREDSTENDGKYTFFDRSEDIRTSSRYLFDDEAIIIAGEGQKFTPKYYKGKFDLHQRTYAILELQIIGKFLYYYTDRFKDYFLQNAVGSTVKSLRLPMFQKMPILLPVLLEQQKIDNTLSSLDNLIEAQQRKVEALKKHKKGLMQQMFVSGEG